MSAQYAAVAQRALASIARKGGTVTFVTATPRKYNEDTGAWIGGDPLTADGKAIQVPDNPMRFQTRNLVVSDPTTLIVAGSGLTVRPAPGMAMRWAGLIKNVVDVEAFEPDGQTAILFTVVGGKL